jgi:hypothetical protein
MKIEFEADNALLGKVLYALAHSAVNPEFSIEYTISDSEKCKNELLAKAVDDSRNKAEVISKAAGVMLGDIFTIDYSWGEINFVTRPVQEMAYACKNTIGSQKPESYDIDIEANNIEVTDTITVVWCIES